MSLEILKNEIANDPLGLGYSGFNNGQIADKLNAVDTGRFRNKTTMESTEVFNSIDKAEFNALSVTNKQLIWDLLHLGTLNPFGLEATFFTDAFGGGSVTITALKANRKTTISRATELGLGTVRLGFVEQAKGE